MAEQGPQNPTSRRTGAGAEVGKIKRGILGEGGGGEGEGRNKRTNRLRGRGGGKGRSICYAYGIDRAEGEMVQTIG